MLCYAISRSSAVSATDSSTVYLRSNTLLMGLTGTGSMPFQMNNCESLHTLHDYSSMAQSGAVQFAGLLKY